MIEIVQPVEINQDQLGLQIELDVDGDLVYSGEGHSFTPQFLSILYSFMAGTSFPLSPTGFRLSGSNDLGTVTMVPVTFNRYEVSPGVYRTRMVGDYSGWANGDYIQVMGIGNGSLGTGINGVWTLTETALNSGIWYLYDLGAGAYLDDADAASLNYTLCSPYAREMNSPTISGRATDESFGNPQICIGYDATANGESPISLNAEIPIVSGTGRGTVTDGSASVSTPTVGSGQSVIEIQQTFTNNNASFGFSVNEIGLWTKARETDTNNRYFCLIARDVLGAPVAVGASQVLTVKYRIIVKVDTGTNDGGILAAFNEVLYRQLAQTSREAKDIDNANQSQTDIEGQFCVAGPGGESQSSELVGNEPGYNLGPQIGHSQKVVTNTDFRLQYAAGDTNYAGGIAIEGEDARYHHGFGTYQVRHSGPLVYAWETGAAPNYAQFKIEKLFDNISGGTIAVREIGLFFGRRDASDRLQEVYAMCRNRVTPFNFLNGDTLKLVYIIRINL